MSDLLTRIGAAPGTGGLRELLADALGDRSLRIAYWHDAKGRWIDPDGHEVELPGRRPPAARLDGVELEGQRVGAIVYDRVLVRGARARAPRSPPRPRWPCRTRS